MFTRCAIFTTVLNSKVPEFRCDGTKGAGLKSTRKRAGETAALGASEGGRCGQDRKRFWRHSEASETKSFYFDFSSISA